VNAAARTLDTGGTSVEKGLVLEEVQVPPSQFIGVVGLAGNPANRAGEDSAPRKIQMDIQTFGRLAKGTAADQPRRQQSEGCLEQFVLIHGGRLPGAPAIITPYN